MLVPGLGVSGRYMDPTAMALAERMTAWVVDLPGFGRTPRRREPPSIGSLTDSVEAWLDLRALDRPLLVGNSLGCQIAVELLLRRPGSFAGAVLTGPTPDPAAPTLLGQFLRLLRVARHEPIRHDLRVAADYLRHGPLYVVGAAQLALRDPVGEKLKRVQDPVAIVRGENDTIASPGWAAHAAGLARGTVHTIAGHGHSVTYSAPGAVAAIALSLLGESA